MLKSSLIIAALLFAGSAYADEVIIKRDAPAVEVEPAPPAESKTTVEKHGPDCDSKSVHTENGAGDSKTVTHENCD